MPYAEKKEGAVKALDYGESFLATVDTPLLVRHEGAAVGFN
jgi:hypothetical protein